LKKMRGDGGWDATCSVKGSKHGRGTQRNSGVRNVKKGKRSPPRRTGRGRWCAKSSLGRKRRKYKTRCSLTHIEGGSEVPLPRSGTSGEGQHSHERRRTGGGRAQRSDSWPKGGGGGEFCKRWGLGRGMVVVRRNWGALSLYPLRLHE